MRRSTHAAVLGIALTIAYAVPVILVPDAAHAAAAKKKPKKGAKKRGGKEDAPPAAEAEPTPPAAPAEVAEQPAPAPEKTVAPEPPASVESAPAAPVAEVERAPTPVAEPTPAAPEPPHDHARFRGGIAAEGGAIVAPGIITLGVAGLQGQLGVQINNLVGLYVVPAFDICFGPLGGINVGSALMVDFTVANNWLTFGAGPAASFFAAIGIRSGGASASAGGLYGGRVHAAVNFGGLGADHVRRKAFVIGVDANLMVGAVGFSSAGSTGATAAGGLQFVVEPMVTLGYQAF